MPLLILVIFVSILVALFAVQNAVTVPMSFVFWEFSTSLVLVILGAFLAGVLVATCFLLAMKAKHYMKDRKMQSEMAKLQVENKRLQERVAMLQHTQQAHDEAQKCAAQQKSAQQKNDAAQSGSSK